MWTAKLLAVTLLLLIFVRDTESRWGQRVRRNYPPPCSPRACQVSYWSTWSPCTRRCGTSGTKTRTRTKTVVEACGGSCPYHLSEIRSCNTDKCQNSGTPTYYGCFCPPGYNGLCCEIEIFENRRKRIDLMMNYYSLFTLHLITATSTLETRPSSAKNISPTPTTLVTSQPPFIKSSPTPCSSRACQVSYWSTWSPCTHQCGTSGTQTRTRTKTVLEACGGSCPYHLSEIRSCNTDKCQNSGTPTSNGCSCPPGYNGTCCEIVPHPVDGQWSEWSVWTLCPPNTCGFATRNRTRSCTNPAPAFGGQKCHGTSAMSQLCPENCPTTSTLESRPSSSAKNISPTPTTLVTTQPPFIKSSPPPCSPRTCQVSYWSTWSPCTHQCGTSGTQTRTRTKTVLAACGGSCPYHLSEIRSCNTDKCQNSGTPTSNGCSCPPGYNGTCCEIVPHPVDGRWSEWSVWTLCPPNACGFATRNRSRTCTNPAPAFGGQKCRGASAMSQRCPENCPTTSPLEPRPCTSMITSNSKFTASSSSEGPGTPVLYGSDVWCAGVINANQYLKVDLGAVVWINQVSVQGKPNSTRSVTQYYIQTSTDNINFAFIFDGSRRKAFFGPFFNGNAVVTTNFTLPVQARYVLFSPTEPLIVLENHLCMRVDIASCQNVTAPSTLKPSSSSSLSVNTMLMSTIPVTTPTPFIVHGGWSQWTYFPCNVPCGAGKRNRTRTCTNPPPSGGGAACPGAALETLDCYNGPCQDPNIPLIDLVFALSATSANSVRSYELMQNTLKAFINKYGVNKIHYSIIVYGDSVIRVVSFNRTFPISASDLKAAIYRQPALFGGPVLKDALQEAFRIFNETVGRPGARKVLVVITDKNSGAPSNALANAVRPLEDNWVLVISVGVGYVERSELNVISPNPLDVISARLKINPSVLAERIMDRILRRNIPDIDIGFAISSASIDSDSIFALMKRIINTIIDRYGMLKIRFSVIVYGSIITTRFTFDNTIMFTQEELLRAVNETQRAPGMPDLQMALTEAKRLFQLTSRPNATKVLVLFSDVVGPTNDSALAECADNLRKEGVLILSVGFGAQVNQIGYQMKKVVISPSDYMAVRNITTQRPVVIAETIMFKVLQVPRPTLFPTSATVDPTSSGLLTIQPEVQRVLVDLLRSFSQVIQRLEVLLGGSLSPTDLETFRNETLQILRQIEDQLVIPSPTQPNNMRMVKRAIPEFPDPQELKQMLENIQRRLLG
ncbi:coadhesin-like [Oculina patagonica]